MRQVAPGEKIRIAATDWNAMQEAADAHRKSKSSGGGGILQATPPERFRNEAATLMPRYGVGWLNDAAFQGVNLVEQPPYPGVSKLVIASSPGSAGGIFEGWTTGLHPVRVAADQFDDIAVGDRIGAQMNSWDAGLDPLGPMQVTGKLDTPLVMAAITGQRGGSVRIHDVRPGESIDNVYQCKTLILSGRIRCRLLRSDGLPWLYAAADAGSAAGDPVPWWAIRQTPPDGGIITIVCKYTFGALDDPWWWTSFPAAGLAPELAYYFPPYTGSGEVLVAMENADTGTYEVTGHGDDVVEVALQ